MLWESDGWESNGGRRSIGRLIKYVYSDRPARREEDGSCATAGVEQG